ncbi:MAG: AmmeMemoRadiSam system protein B [Planctomycetes bacterium]|nr:AmmeMemoRadiSam system protein B [Planctomycetota bacterium]
MPLPTHPRIRQLELVPLDVSSEEGADPTFALRDPHGFAGTASLPMGAAMLVTLMNGERTLEQLQTAFAEKVGQPIALAEVEKVVQQLDERMFLDNENFAAHKAAITTAYDELDVRPAAHAGGAYQGELEALQSQLAELFTCEEGPGLLPSEGNINGDFTSTDEVAGRLCGVMSPHIDLHRGGPAFAWAYDRIVAESDAKVFVILGTAHTPLQGLFSVSRKHFETPLGIAHADREFIDALHDQLAARAGEAEAERIFHDELPHRREHSIEFQTLMLQYVLGGRRDYTIVPILVDSFHPFVLHHRSPGETPAVSDFTTALQATIAACGKQVCFIAGVDMAHIGQQFGDDELLDDARLTQQWTDDQVLLSAACEGDTEGWFIHVAAVQDRNRICGLAPTYTMLQAMQPARGEILKYDQAVADDRTSCVSFASVAFYE